MIKITTLLLFVLLIINVQAKDDLTRLLLSESELGTLKAVDAPQPAEGEVLYKLIDGGAVLFFKHNFKRALFQEYVSDSGTSINLEIYQMGSPENAAGIYNANQGAEGKKMDVGQEGTITDYYCVFRQGPFYVTITGSEPTESTQKILVEIAGAVAGKIK